MIVQAGILYLGRPTIGLRKSQLWIQISAASSLHALVKPWSNRSNHAADPYAPTHLVAVIRVEEPPLILLHVLIL